MIVLDTCVTVWLTTEPEKLSKAANQSIADAAREGSLAISAVTFYEVAWLVEHGRIQIGISLDQYLARIEGRLRVLSINPVIARLAVKLPDSYPRDPMDRMIGATTLAHEAVLVTPDKLIHASGAVPVIW